MCAKSVNIIFIGMLGSGKTTIASRVAEELGRLFIDLDGEITIQTGRTPADWFRQGEKELRRIECHYLSSVLQENNVVLATGGGIVSNHESNSLLIRARQHGDIIVWLYASAECILARIGQSKRAILEVGDKLSNIRSMIANREPLYQNLAQITVDTTGRQVAEIVTEVIQQLHGRGVC